MDFNAAIFDLDGTILDSMDVWEHIDIQFLKKRNLPVPENYVTEICARSFEEAAQYTIDLLGLQETVEGIIEEWNNMAVEEYRNHVGLLPYALDYLLRLKEHGIKLAVATGLPEKLYIPCLKNNSILEASNPVPTPLLGHRCRSSQEITGSPTPFSTSNHYLWICPRASFSLSNPNIAA